ncbi:transglycosylase SLT domain-containing protein [Streptomyces yaanensis]|uniref:Transglycosylase SLT domain-containing protein n=1 Tax=Streptomyces yaanensis TaxID=1142239 RepID=A0ABV7SK26_9ACTN|nr:transglycosylase SLT domain-containing protein [Streptomyces sp. CGMCC 4.7035]WNC01034.1 transglycosylase SLT domain-containing protein [Streptomyces sp. CGMCC 4.7035]
MPNTNIRGRSRALTKTHKLSIACVAALGAAALAFTAVPSSAQTTTDEGAAASAPVTFSNEPIKDVKVSVTDQLAGSHLKAEAIAARKQAADEAVAAKKRAVEQAAQKARQAAEQARQAAEQARQAAEQARQRAAQQAEAQRRAREAASRAAQRPQVRPAAPKSYGNNLDGWIRHALDIMAQHKIPGSYNGLHRNILRESSGNPMAINNWDSNAAKGIPSKGLLQVIDPTFRAYHVAGTSWNIYDPVANITAAANYAAHRYGSMDNVNSAY